MTYLISQIVVCLLLAALFGFIIGWAVRSMSCQKRISELEAAWADRLAAAAGGGPVQRDDLKRIEGIGPKIEKMLNDDQIYTWADLATSPVDRLKSILRRGGDRYKMHDPTSWPDQAKLAAQGRWKELEELQDILQGGREG
jgi:predicted flap endonuclease-1-like 5' DNA nuclease